MNRLDDPPGLMKGRKTSFIGMNGGPETDDQQRLRFQVELEFVQCLANPNYLNFLAQRGYFKDTTFINYLKYLLYWKEPEYAKYLKYPMCLYFLDLLQYEHFRREVVNSQCTKFIDDQQILLWQHYTRRRTRLLQTAVEQTQHANLQNNGISGLEESSSSVQRIVTKLIEVTTNYRPDFDGPIPKNRSAMEGPGKL